MEIGRAQHFFRTCWPSICKRQRRKVKKWLKRNWCVPSTITLPRSPLWVSHTHVNPCDFPTRSISVVYPSSNCMITATICSRSRERTLYEWGIKQILCWRTDKQTQLFWTSCWLSAALHPHHCHGRRSCGIQRGDLGTGTLFTWERQHTFFQKQPLSSVGI